MPSKGKDGNDGKKSQDEKTKSNVVLVRQQNLWTIDTFRLVKELDQLNKEIKNRRMSLRQKSGTKDWNLILRMLLKPTLGLVVQL